MSEQFTPVKGAGERHVFDYMRGYMMCAVFSSLQSMGVMDDLATKGLRAEDLGTNAFLAKATLEYLTQREIVEFDGDLCTLTDLGREIYADRGYLVWLSGGYGHAMNRFGDLLTGTCGFGKDVDRDVRWVAIGAAILGRKDLWPYVAGVARKFEFSQIADLGCGNAHYLISLCQEVGADGIGVDISPDACDEARQEVAKAGLNDRITIIEADAGNLSTVPGMGGVQLVINFFFLHEVLEKGYDVLVAYLRQVQESLPRGAHVLTAEVAPPGAEPGTRERFAPEYALTQALMEQHLLNEDGWRRAFTDAGFEVREVIRPDLPEARLILAQKPA